MRKVLGLLVTLALLAAACGDDSPLETDSTVAGSTTTTSGGDTTAPTTTTTEGTTTTTTEAPVVVTGTTGAMAGMQVEDPLMGTGWHQMEWADEDRTILQSSVSTTGTDGMDLLTLFTFDPPPGVGGLADDQVLVGAFLSMPTSDISPSAVVVYTPGADGFEATVAVTTPQIEAAMLETTDYAAAAPAGEAAFEFVPTLLKIGATKVTGDLEVFDVDGNFETAYEGEIECDFSAAPLTCVTLTDDGIWRPGDEGDEVEAIQEDLAVIGYLTGNVDGKYGPATEDAVRRFQRDFLLTADGKVGPQTRGLLEDVAEETTDLMLISGDGFLGLPFGTGYQDARNWIISWLGTPDADTGWYLDGCDGHDWRKLTWDGFTAVFTDRDGTHQFDGWHIDDLSDLPPKMYVAGGIHAGTTWSYLDTTLGADYYNDYLGQRWRIPAMGYGNGRFPGPVTDPPAGNSAIKSFGTGTGGFESC